MFKMVYSLWGLWENKRMLEKFEYLCSNDYLTLQGVLFLLSITVCHQSLYSINKFIFMSNILLISLFL